VRKKRCGCCGGGGSAACLGYITVVYILNTSGMEYRVCGISRHLSLYSGWFVGRLERMLTAIVYILYSYRNKPDLNLTLG